MGFIKDALGMIGDAATGGMASGVGSFVSGLFGGGGGIGYHDQKKLMEKQHGYELENFCASSLPSRLSSPSTGAIFISARRSNEI